MYALRHWNIEVTDRSELYKFIGPHSLGVLYGCGSREELEAAGADNIAETVENILDFV